MRRVLIVMLLVFALISVGYMSALAESADSNSTTEKPTTTMAPTTTTSEATTTTTVAAVRILPRTGLPINPLLPIAAGAITLALSARRRTK